MNPFVVVLNQILSEDLVGCGVNSENVSQRMLVSGSKNGINWLWSLRYRFSKSSKLFIGQAASGCLCRTSENKASRGCFECLSCGSNGLGISHPMGLAFPDSTTSVHEMKHSGDLKAIEWPLGRVFAFLSGSPASPKLTFLRLNRRHCSPFAPCVLVTFISLTLLTAHSK